MNQSYFVDAHCHLDLFNNIQKFASTEDALSIKTISVTNSPGFFEPNAKLFSGATNIRIALGLHPELVPKFHNQIDLFEKLIGSTKYIGELGLDGSKDFIQTLDLQILTLRNMLSIIKSVDNKILTVHTRNAAKETIDLLYSYLRNTNCKVVLHWFSGNLSNLKKATDCGYYFSINHKMVSYSKGKELIKNIPRERLLTETDAPFTFDNRIGNRIESLTYTIDMLADILKIDSTQTKDLVYNNFKQLLS